MKIVFAIFSFILFCFVALQLNDPDPILWVPIYGYGALVLALSALGKYNKWATIIGIVGYATGAAYLFPSVIDWLDKENGQNLMERMVDSKMYIEETRECGGLIIALSFLMVNYVFGKDVKVKRKVKP